MFGRRHMEQRAFLCRLCGIELTDFLSPADQQALLFRRGEAAVPYGYYVRISRPSSYREFVSESSADQYTSPDGDEVAFATGDYLVNSESVRYRMSRGAAYGCCGPQPRGEANAVCANGHEVGTVHGDECWSPLVFRLLGAAVEVVTVGGEGEQ